MIVNPELSKRRFERDLLPLREHETIYQKLGIKLKLLDYPFAEVSFWWKLKQKEIRLKIFTDEYDYLPPSAWWIDKNGNPLLKGQGEVPYNYGFQTEDGHPHNKRQSWLCFRGWREYHDHQSHQDVSWSSLRNQPAYHLPMVLIQLNSDLNKEGVTGQ